MSTLRLVATIVVREGLHVQSIGFRKYLPIGSPIESACEFDRWGIDEIAVIFLDANTDRNRMLTLEICKKVATPLTIVGGIRTLSDARTIIASGADKIGFNKALLENPNLIRDSAQYFGEQCIVGSIDLVRVKERPFRWDYWMQSASNIAATEWVRSVQQLGVGEILLNFPFLDGSGLGMDVETIRDVVAATTLPVTAVGGVGKIAHLSNCYSMAKPSGIGVGNRLAHFEHSVLLAKRNLADSGAPVRSVFKASYEDSPILSSGRPAKKSDAVLSDLLFRRIDPEHI
jgi:cyclase